ncbi:unnamed protein product [Acanthocheilonema viteae]|uniref:FYVE-type domain-containing protein n=1 Tax=Acanthocheilonema viteae TaxID=6277 RepID=A0A498SGJ4_ACAVI|nr:unnamed protein product [Acanthocheilonema viteae]
MLRKLKRQVTQAVNSVTPSEPQHVPLYNESDTSSEGFLCPVCMHSFSSPDELQIHFKVHTVKQINNIEEQKVIDSSSFNSFGNGFNESDVIHLELDMKELRSQLQDEKRYSMELKKELDRLHGLIANQAEISEDEVPYLTQQMQVLEAGKALATERMLEMEKETSGMNRQVEQLKQEKSRLIKKIGELSTNITSKTDEIEEKNKEKALLGDELVRYRQEIQNLEVEIEDLRKKLDQRLSEDDVSVLRKELIHAQQLMDTITQEKEEEIKKDIDRIRDMEQDHKKLTCEIEVLKSNIKVLKNTIAEFDSGSKKLIDEIDTFRKVWEEKATNATERISDACKKVDDLEVIVNGYRIDNGTEGKKFSELEDVKKSLLEVSQENERYKNEIRQSKHALEEAVSRAEKAEKQHINLQQEIMLLTASLDEQKQNYVEKEMQAVKEEETVIECRKEIEQLKKNVLKLEISLTEASTTEDILKQNLKEAKAKESLLMQKISEGEGVDKLAVEHMHKEKMALEETVNGLNEALKSLNVSHEYAISQHEESWKEKIEVEKEKVRKLENELKKLHCNCISAREENKKLSAMLEEKIATIEEKNKIIETESAKLKSAVERFTLIEEKARQLDNELHEKETVAIRHNEEYMKLEETIKNVQSELKEIKTAKKRLECNLAEKEESSKKSVCQLQEALSTCEQEKNALKEQLESVTQQFSALVEECSKYKDNEVKLLANVNQKELSIKELEEKIKNLTAKLEFERHKHDDSIKDLQHDLRYVLTQASFQEMVTQLKTISELNEKLRMKGKQLSDVMQEKERVHSELRLKEEEKCALENEVLKLNEQNSELRKEVDDFKKYMLQLRSDFEKEIDLLKSNLEKCKKDKEESLSKLYVELETEKNRLKQASKDNEEKDENLKQMKNDLENAKGDLSELKNVQSELEKRKTEWLQEKRALQERCLTAESDLEFERERAIVNKRNFDDVQTAIRELGQMNQNLQLDFAKQISRKWLEDSEAINCHACDKPFTLTTRKHHCRQCGQIFCASCSSFTAKIASSRNPVRVCNACHEEIVHR